MKTYTVRFAVLASISIVLLFCLANANLANATAIYTFSLPANGSVSAFSISLTAPDLLPAGPLFVIPVTAPVVTSLSFTTPGFNPAGSVLGLQITPTTTLIGVALLNTGGPPPPPPLLLTTAFPGDFFMFSRTPLATGTFSSFSGNVVSSLPLTTTSPLGTLTVTSTPEPSSLLLLGSGVLALAACYRRRRDSA